MPREKAGKIIKKIKFNKKAIAIYFDDGERIDISEDAYASSYLYIGKELDKKDIEKLQSITMVKALISYAMKLLTKGHYTEWKMREKLYNKDGEKKDVDFVINLLKTHDLIDDKAFIEDYIGYADERCIGKNKIKQELINKGVFAEEINKIRFSETNEKRKAVSKIKSLEKKYDRLSYEKKKEHIFSTLVSQGFDVEVANYALTKIKDKNEKDESKKLDNDFEKIYNRLKVRYEGQVLYDKLLKALHNKGYRYGDIKRKIGELNNDF